MYLRITSRKNKDGSKVEYYQLAHNERDPKTKKPVARIIHNFGRADKLDKEQLIRLSKSISRVCGMEFTESQAGNNSEAAFFDELSIKETMAFGAPLVIKTLWKRLGIQKVLTDKAKSETQRTIYERALLAMTANRLCEPESKLGVWDRWLSKVYLPCCQGLKLNHMYEAMDYLHEHAVEVEEAIFHKVADLFNLEVDLIFYDTTTASFHTDQEDDPARHENATLRKFEHTKEGNWAPQVVVALAVTREGIPVRSWVFPGNTSDVSTIEQIRTDLRGWSLGRAMFVADSGMNSEGNRAEMARACGKYLLACRMAGVVQIKRDVLAKRGRYTVFKENLHAKEVIVGDGERRKRYILCYNPNEAERQRKHREMIVDTLEQELKKHKETSATAQWAIELLASRRFKRYLRVTKGNKICIDRGSIKQAAKYDGKWVLETNDDTISLEDAALGYRGLMIIERCFRSLKRTQIKMMPMYHWASRRIESHVKICMLALLIERIAELECLRPWHQIKRALDGLQITKLFHLNFHVLMRNEISPEASNILNSLRIKAPNKVIDLKKVTENGPNL